MGFGKESLYIDRMGWTAGLEITVLSVNLGEMSGTLSQILSISITIN